MCCPSNKKLKKITSKKKKKDSICYVDRVLDAFGMVHHFTLKVTFSSNRPVEVKSLKISTLATL